VDRGDVATGADKRLVAGQEVAHGGLRGGGQLRRGVQPRVERLEVAVLRLGPQIAPADIKADLVDAPPLDQRPRQVGRAVGDDGERRRGFPLFDVVSP
jgi:hypothetical protein